jgi:hypothetical protein
MEDLFGTLVGLIPIAAIIAIRLFASMKKGQQSRQSQSAPREFFEDDAEEKSFRPHWETDKESRASPFPAAAPRIPARQAGLSKPREGLDRNRAAAQRFNDAASAKFQKTTRAYEERAARSGVAAVPNQAVRRSGGPASGASVPKQADSNVKPGTQRLGQSSSFPENLACYTPLQQAVIMAEILGPPKGFD